MSAGGVRDGAEMLFLSQNEVIATQSTETMSLPLTSMSVVTTFLWVVYGVLQWDFYVIVSPACACPDVGQGWSRVPVLNTHGVVPPSSPSPPLQAPNAMGLLLACVQLLLFIVYWQTPRKRVVSLDKPI